MPCTVLYVCMYYLVLVVVMDTVGVMDCSTVMDTVGVMDCSTSYSYIVVLADLGAVAKLR